MRIRVVVALFLAVSCVFACEHDCSEEEIQVAVDGHVVYQESRLAANARAHADGVTTPPDAPRFTRDTDKPTIVFDVVMTEEGEDTERPHIHVTDGTRVLVTMSDPGKVGTFALADLGAAACEDVSDCGTDADMDAREDAGEPLCPLPQHLCTPVVGRLVIDTYDTSCELPDDACTRFAAHVWIDPPPILEDGPIVFGEASTTERHVKDQKTCDGCGCSGGGGLEPGSL